MWSAKLRVYVVQKDYILQDCCRTPHGVRGFK